MLPRLLRLQRGLAVASFAAFLVSLALGVPLQAQTPKGPRKTENVLLITFDGLRWQELFYGADRRLMNKEQGGVEAEAPLKAAFDRATPAERREAVFPWFWSVVAKQGQVFGDPEHNSAARVTNTQHFSYPGYNELLSGFGDPRIDSNDKKPNPNVTVLEFLNRRPGFEGRVGAVTSWDVFPWIINTERSGVPVNAGWAKPDLKGPEMARLDELAREVPKSWAGVRYDYWTSRIAEEWLKQKRPRVFYVSFGETEDWAHAGRYDLVLDSARRTDEYIRRLWEQVQADPEYAGKTSLVLTTDHGRGDDRDGWKSHKADVPGSDRIWMAVLGPDTPALGVRSDADVTQSQVAATVAALLGEDFQQANPQAAAPLPGVVD
jgi:hypothetical protein